MLSDDIASALARYDCDADLGVLFDTLRALARDADPGEMERAVQPYRERADVMFPVWEEIVKRRPTDARALVALANAYWLTGRGPEVVGQLAERAKAADPANRGAWHLWALAQPDVRARVDRWRVVSERFPADQLARAAMADNAAGLAGAEQDPEALDLAIRTYEGLLKEAASPTQRRALEQTLDTLRSWNL